MSAFAVGDYVELTPEAKAKCTVNALRDPVVLRVCNPGQAAKEKGHVAFEVLTGDRIYGQFAGPPATLRAARPCYGCKLASHMNDPNTVRCDAARGHVVDSSGTCEKWTSRISSAPSAQPEVAR